MTTERELFRIRDLAANYSDRQGLRVVPMALAILLQAVPLPGAGSLLDTHLLILIAGIIGYPLVGAYYRRRFGHVEEHPYPGVSFPLQAALFTLLLIVVMAVDAILIPPVFLSGILVATWLILASWPSRAIRTQYGGLGVALTFVALAPLLGVSQRTTAMTYGVVFGAALLASGVIEHVRFTRLMSRPQETTQ